MLSFLSMSLFHESCLWTGLQASCFSSHCEQNVQCCSVTLETCAGALPTPTPVTLTSQVQLAHVNLVPSVDTTNTCGTVLWNKRDDTANQCLNIQDNKNEISGKKTGICKSK